MASEASFEEFHYDEHDSIDFISERLTILLLKRKEINFNKLNGLIGIHSDKQTRRTYCEIIVLAITKYLGLSNAFREEAKDNREAHVAYNALGLHKEEINEFFVKFVAVLNPEIITSVTVVLSQVAAKLASKNHTTFTQQRLQILENRINNLIQTGTETAIIEEESDNEAEAETPKKARKGSKVGLISYYGKETKAFIRPRTKSEVRSSSSKSNNVKHDNLKVGKLEPIAITRKGQTNIESAEDTARRLAKLRVRERRDIPDIDDDVESIEDVIKSARSKFPIINDGSIYDI